MPALSRDSILAADDRPTKTVNVPEWGGDVILRTMSGTERNAYDQANLRQQGDQFVWDPKNIHARLLCVCLVDDNGERLFTSPTELGQKSSKVLARLFEIAQELNGISPAAVEEAGKDSEDWLSDDSSSV